MSELVLSHGFEQSVDLPAPRHQVFDYLDDFERLGAHMMRSSWMMAGSRMRYQFDAARGRAVGAQLRLTGAFFGIALTIAEEVVERQPPLFKSWRTIGVPRMLILAAYRMGFSIEPTRQGSRLQVFIEYAIPQGGIGRLLGRFFAGMYSRWCVRSMLASATEKFGAAPASTAAATSLQSPASRSAPQ
jgi:hypothetical protein